MLSTSLFQSMYLNNTSTIMLLYLIIPNPQRINTPIPPSNHPTSIPVKISSPHIAPSPSLPSLPSPPPPPPPLPQIPTHPPPPLSLQLPPQPNFKFAPPNPTASISSSSHFILPNLAGNWLRSHTSPFAASGSRWPSSWPEWAPMPP